jgi:HlyD family secretion protein
LDIKRDTPTKTRQYVMWTLGLVMMVSVLVGVTRLKPAVPTVERGSLWTDVVAHGEMKREVHGSGNLQPEHVLIISALTGGRVEALPVRPGERVTPTTEIVQLSNTDVELQALGAEQQLTQAQSALASLRTALVQQLLSEESVLAETTAQYKDAMRNVSVQEALDSLGAAAKLDVASVRDHAAEVRTRLDVEKRRHDEMIASERQQVALVEEQVARLRAIVSEQTRRVNSMHVSAGQDGVLELLGNPPLELGQWVNPGAELARVARPGRLKAVLRVPELQARDIAPGQVATIDLHNNSRLQGRVTRADPSAQNGTVSVEVSLDEDQPQGARAEQSVDGTIEIERLPNAVFVRRPANGQAESVVPLFRIEPNAGYAQRVNVKLGRGSTTNMEILNGLSVGDSIIISDMSTLGNVKRVKLK